MFRFGLGATPVGRVGHRLIPQRGDCAADMLGDARGARGLFEMARNDNVTASASDPVATLRGSG
jgi:hypothetical protein